MLPLRIDPDPSRDETVIEGVRYANAVFRHLGIAPAGTLLRILGRQGETLTVERVPDRDDGLADQLAILTKTRFHAGDVIVARGDFDQRTIHEFREAIFKALPDVRDTLLIAILKPDGDLYALPEEEARKLYAHLHARFGGAR